MPPSMNKTLPGFALPDAPTRERVGILEYQVREVREDVREVKASIGSVEDKLDQVLFALAAKNGPKSDPPKDSLKLNLSGKTLAGLGVGFLSAGAGLFKLIEFLAKP